MSIWYFAAAAASLCHVGRGEWSVGGLTEFEDEAFESAGRAKQKHVCGLVADDLKAVG